MKIILAMAAVGAAALMCIGGAMPAEAHNTYSYMNIVVNITGYEVTEYSGFDLVRMKVSIEVLDDWIPGTDRSDGLVFKLLSGNKQNTHVAYADVRGKGGDVSVSDCSSKDRFDTLTLGEIGETNICFMVGKQFDAEALAVEQYSIGNPSHDTHNSKDKCFVDKDKFSHTPHYCARLQVIPFHDESAACFVNNAEFCNKNNIQPIDGTPVPQPEPEPEQEPKPATLLYTIYNNHTGTLTMVFDKLVVASNPDRIHLIHDIDAFIEDGTAPNLDDAELNTVDDKRQSAMLAFTLSDTLRLEVIQSLQDSADLALSIETRAIYAAEGFVPVEPILIPDITVIR